MSDLTDLNIVQAAEGLRSKKFSSEDLVNACLVAIGEKDGDLNAFVYVDEDGAMQQAKKIDAKIAAGEADDLPVLAGIPLGIKDLIATKGIRTTNCSNFTRNFVPPYDATCVKKLKEQEAVILGKTNLDEFACGASTEHSCFGVTKNPYDLERVAGGSSGGSAAGVAAGLCFGALGTDTGGSVRQPASFCGVYGLRGTYGRVSRSGVTAMASSWDTVGPLAKTPEDVAILLQGVAGHDPFDSTTPDVEVPNYLEFLQKGVKGMRIGLPKEYFGDGVDKDVRDSVMEAVKTLEKQGAVVEEMSLPMTKYAVAVYYVSIPAELSANLERFDGVRYGTKAPDEVADFWEFYKEARGAGFGDEIKRRIIIGSYVLSAGYYDAFYKKAQKVRTKIIQDFEAAFEKYDVLIGPVAPTPAFKIGEFVDNPLAMYMADALAIPANAAGLASLSCPVSLSAGLGDYPSGLPIGLQVIAPQFEEGRCLTVANSLADAV